jgi:hypothetical protein
LEKKHGYVPYTWEKRKFRPTAPTYMPRATRDWDTIDVDADWKKKIKCYTCNNFGHYVHNCPQEISIKAKIPPKEEWWKPSIHLN